MWDLLITAGNIVIIPAMLGTALDKRSYIPRLTSGISLVGLTTVIVGLFGAGLVFSPIILILIEALWVFIFLFRHEPPGAETTTVIPEIGVAVHTDETPV
jgi:hypothetical protein